jgi:hypothetical protein
LAQRDGHRFGHMPDHDRLCRQGRVRVDHITVVESPRHAPLP